MASMWPSTVVRFAPIVTTDMWLPPAWRHAAISPGHWLSPRLYCWMDSKPNASASLPSSRNLAVILALIWIASVCVRPENRNPSPIPAARSNAASLKPPSQIGILRFGRGIIPALSIWWSESSYWTTGCSHRLRIKAICCSCRLPRRRKCLDISRPSYSTQFQPTPTPKRSRPSENRSTSAACLANRAVRRGVRPDLLTDQTSSHDVQNGYLPKGWTLEQWEDKREHDPQAVEVAARASIAEHVQAMLAFRQMGVPVFDYGNNIRQVAKDEGVPGAFDFPGFVPAYIRPLFCRGIGPFRWAALSGDPEDIFRTDARVKELLPHDKHLHNWLDMAKKRITFQGLPARICWLGLGDRHRVGLAFNEMVASGELKAPIVIGRDHLDSGSVASPNRETEAMKDGSDAVSDWPMLNALLNCASGATWVSLHHGGGVGIGYSQHAGMVVVCDGTPEAAQRIERVLWNDPASGVMRHADAGYEAALACACELGLKLPSVS